MNGIQPLMAGVPAEEIDYPTGDGQPMESGIHVLLMLWLISTLRHHFRRRDDYYVIGNIFLFYEKGQPGARRSPDVMLIKGVDASRERRSFMTWKENAVPAVVIELTSKATAEEDKGPKYELYQRLGVREYFLFDPWGEYLERPLMGYLLINGAYEELVPAADGGLNSLEMGLRLVPEGQNLTLFDFRTGERLLTPPETAQHLTETQQRLTTAHQHSVDLEKELTTARQQLVALRAELDRLRQAPPGPVAGA